MGLLANLFKSRDSLRETEAKLKETTQTVGRINKRLDVAIRALNGDRSYLTCTVCGCGGNWHYKGCEVAKERGDTMFLVKGGWADQMAKQP